MNSEYIYKHDKRYKNNVYFTDFYNDDTIEYKRKYVNDWCELRKFVGLDDIDLENNELTIVNMRGYAKIKKEMQEKMNEQLQNFNVLRIMAGMPGLAYSY